jgi:NitT/TauT family transport system permease protein
MPIIVLLLIWEIAVFALKIPAYLLPPPSLIGVTLYNDAGMFAQALWVTLKSLIIAFIVTCVAAPLLATVFHVNKRVAKAAMPFIIIMQVTPLVAVIPLLLIWFDANSAVIIAGVLIAIIPLFMSIKAGLETKDDDLTALFTLYKATNMQQFWHLNRPHGQARFMETLPLTGSLALVGTIVGEFMAGTGAGLAARLIESQYRLNTPRMFACLVIIAVVGLVLNWFMSQLSRHQP